MRALLREAAVMVTALALAAGAVYLLHDRETMVPPPERVVEDFLRALAAGRPEGAREKLADDLRARMNEDALRAWAREHGARRAPISKVEAESRPTGETTADVSAEVTFEDGEQANLEFRLQESRGLWKISDLGSRSPFPG